MSSAIAFYEECLATNESVAELLEFIVDNLGGSPLLFGANWKSELYDFVDSLLGNLVIGNAPLFAVEVGVDEKNTSANIIYIDQAEMNLDVDYYLDPEGYSHVLDAYHQLIINITKALVDDVNDDVDNMAKDIISLETSIANISSSFIDRQNSTRKYNRMTVGQLQNITDPEYKILNWTSFLRALIGIDDVTEDEEIIVNEPTYMTNLFEILNNTDKGTLANYIAWNFILYAQDDAFGSVSNLYFDFQQVIGGAKNRTERWEKCIDNIKDGFAYAISQIFLKNYVDETVVTEANEMLSLLQNSFIERLLVNKFMDNETKSVAIEKVKKMYKYVGYPDMVKNTTKLEDYYKHYPKTVNGHYLLDALGVVRAATKQLYSVLRDKPDPTEFYVSPLDVNAFYTPTYNSIAVPLAIINPPFFQKGAPSGANFGALGSILGHEITHGFDNDGRKFDKNGNLNEWWPKTVVERFDVQSKCFVRQYSQCCPLIDTRDNSTTCVNGLQTLGENIADNGGLTASYLAWQDWTKEHGEDKKLPGMEDFTPEQIFFLSYANVWCESYTLGSILAEISGDEHAPESCRVNGAAANSVHFSNAFNCSIGPMNRGKKKCAIW
ncbi:hypothetical protein CHUAL_000127 [Chamberlinius hualienensis]